MWRQAVGIVPGQAPNERGPNCACPGTVPGHEPNGTQSRQSARPGTVPGHGGLGLGRFGLVERYAVRERVHGGSPQWRSLEAQEGADRLEAALGGAAHRRRGVSTSRQHQPAKARLYRPDASAGEVAASAAPKQRALALRGRVRALAASQ